MRSERRILVWVVVALMALFIGACDSDDDGDEADGGPSPSPSASPLPESTIEPSVSAGGLFEEELVVGTVTTDEGQLIVYLVDEISADPAMLLQECTTAYADQAGEAGVTCYLFATTEAFEAAEVSDDDDSMENECWTAYFGVGPDGGRGELENAAYGAECP